MSETEVNRVFKKCTMCKFIWKERNKFLGDPKIEMIGYQADIENLEYGLFLFNHHNENCGSTIAVRVHQFKDLYDGPVYFQCLLGTEECHELCLHKNNLEPCPAKCECSYVRELVQTVKNWEKV
ncbi:MAG: hypothetical protein HF978_13985 [Desulfobacteraceae bacterium]|nr:hypothetical protein [Desulfobacteraceae bacterium]MBC2756649.1 hypothetical protein [Desulfobacteraceae bacterium]